MAFQAKQFFFERYSGGGIDIIVRQTTSPTDPVYADVVLDKEKVAELFEYLGFSAAENSTEIEDLRDELEASDKENLKLRTQVENFTSESADDDLKTPQLKEWE